MHFAPCPPGFALLLNLRKTHGPADPPKRGHAYDFGVKIMYSMSVNAYSQHRARGGGFAQVKEEPEGRGTRSKTATPGPVRASKINTIP